MNNMTQSLPTNAANTGFLPAISLVSSRPVAKSEKRGVKPVAGKHSRREGSQTETRIPV